MKALVTGGGGFLGKNIVKQLCQRGVDVLSLARGSYPEVEKMGATSVRFDLCSRDGLDEILQGIDVVFHTAAKAGVWGPKETFWSINVHGTENLLKAAQRAGVKKFIYTSSPSAVWNGSDEENLREEDCPYPTSYLTTYPQTKAIAEQFVLQANSDSFATTALRPHLIWGPEDPHLIPRLLARANKLRIVGDGNNKVGLTYVENAAYAHILAEKNLKPGSPNAGKAYFITDLQPVVLWEWINRLLVSVGKNPIKGKISVKTAYRVGAILEWLYRTFRISGEPKMTRFVAKQLACAHYYDLTAAKTDFGYTELVAPEEAWNQTIRYFG